MGREGMSSAAQPASILDGAPRQLRVSNWSLWQLVTIFAVMLMYISWISLLYKLLINDRFGIGINLYFSVIIMSTYFITRMLHFLQLERPAPEIGLFAILILYAIITIAIRVQFLEGPVEDDLEGMSVLSQIASPLIISLALVTLIWRKGIKLARHSIGPLMVHRDFRSGVFVIIIVGLFTTTLDVQIPVFEVFLFLICSLLAMSGARLTANSYLRGGGGLSFDRRWFVGIVVIAVVTILTVGLVAYLVAELLAGVVATIFTSVIALIAYIFLLIVGPIILLLLPVFSAIFERFSLFTEAMDFSAPDVDEFMTEIETLRPAWIDDLFSLLGIVLIVVLFLILGAYILRGLRRIYEQRRQQVALHPDEITSLGTLGSALREAFQKQADRFKERFSQWRTASQILAMLRIRRIYARLMKMSSDLGFPRHPSCTPREFLDVLFEHFPAHQSDLTLITDSYVRVRYGEFPESSQEVDAVEAAWSRVRAEGKQVKKRRDES